MKRVYTSPAVMGAGSVIGETKSVSGSIGEPAELLMSAGRVGFNL